VRRRRSLRWSRFLSLHVRDVEADSDQAIGCGAPVDQADPDVRQQQHFARVGVLAERPLDADELRDFGHHEIIGSAGLQDAAIEVELAPEGGVPVRQALVVVPDREGVGCASSAVRACFGAARRAKAGLIRR
jgi:hypothetical protein